MAKLPPEILSKVFQGLDYKDKLECAVVCQAWCGTALHYLNSKLRLKTREDVTNLFMKLCALEGTIDGRSIRQLLFSRTWGTSLASVQKTIFIYILSECKHLQVLEFEEEHSTELYCDYMIRYRSVLQLGSLQRIIAPSAARYSSSYLLVNWEYRQSINQLEFELVKDNLEDIPNVVDVYSYIRQFSALHTLILGFHTMVCLHSLLCACPQLGSLQLYYGCVRNHLKIYQEHEKPDQQSNFHTNFQLKYLDIDAQYVSQDLFKYLHDHTGMLTHLSINNNSANTETFAEAFTTPFVVDTTLPIRSMKINYHQVMSNEMIAGLNDNFHALKRIDFHYCKFGHILTQDNNLLLNFNALRLDYLSVDFTSIVSQNTLINSMCLVVKRHKKETLFYQRATKWSQHLFTRNEALRYTSSNAQAKRIVSTSVAVITVEAKKLNYIRMHCNGYRDFSQVITLD
ncbi:electron carrier [Mucor velutinosus]|uniref:Electron carrier n=1 Tax=Mucor velutinosus TaxID=708070 RepID=A0AAN7DQJ0_9FUNG|nr:electron carrier [Mucor velutinosus]